MLSKKRLRYPRLPCHEKKKLRQKEKKKEPSATQVVESFKRVSLTGERSICFLRSILLIAPEKQAIQKKQSVVFPLVYFLLVCVFFLFISSWVSDEKLDPDWCLVTSFFTWASSSRGTKKGKTIPAPSWRKLFFFRRFFVDPTESVLNPFLWDLLDYSTGKHCRRKMLKKHWRISAYKIVMMLDLAQNSPPKSKNTNTDHYSRRKTGPLPIKDSPIQYVTSTNNAACKDEYWPKIRRTHGWRP